MPKFNINSHALITTRCIPWIRHKICVVCYIKVQLFRIQKSMKQQSFCFVSLTANSTAKGNIYVQVGNQILQSL